MTCLRYETSINFGIVFDFLEQYLTILNIRGLFDLPNYLIWTLAAKSRQQGSGQNNQKTFHRSGFISTGFSFDSNKLLTEWSPTQLIERKRFSHSVEISCTLYLFYQRAQVTWRKLPQSLQNTHSVPEADMFSNTS